MKSIGKKHVRMQIFHKNKDSTSIDQKKKKKFILLAMKTSANRVHFVAKRNFISGNFHFGSHVPTL